MENMVVDHDFWKNKKVLITGHTGFKGAWLSLWLQSMGAEVFGLSLPPPTNPSLFERAEVESGMQSRIRDIRDIEAVLEVVREAEPEIVFHLAAQSLVRLSYDDPVTTFGTNVMGTVNLLEAVRRAVAVDKTRIGAVLVITSDKCYENQEWQWGYREVDPLGGRDPYSNSKGCAEMVVDSFRRSFFSGPDEGVALASARAGNVVGGGDWAVDRLVPDAVSAFSCGNELRIRRPNAVRPWQHVLEPLGGYLMLAQQLVVGGQEYAEAWNFGPDSGSEQSVGHVIDMLAKLWGEDSKWATDSGEHPHEAGLLKLDSSKARNILGWRPRLDLRQTLALTTDWYQADLNGESMREFSLAQISHCGWAE